MKSIFLRVFGRLGGGASLILLGLLLPSLPALATDSIRTFAGSVTSLPQPPVDATNFVNNGTWDIFTATPYNTAHTLNYTNENSMVGSVGWEFDYGPLAGTGGRGLSSTFFNDNNAIVQAEDGFSIFGRFLLETESFLWISATNIINKGSLEAGAAGEIVLTGQNVLLSRSALEIAPIAGFGSSNSTTNETPDTAIYDEYWQQTNATFSSTAIWDGTNAASPNFTAFDCGGTISTRVGPFRPDVVGSVDTTPGVMSIVITNGFSNDGLFTPMTSMVSIPTNIVHQAVFVNLGDPNINAQIHFSPSGNSTNFYDTVAIRFAMTSTNFITLALATNTLYLVDNLASAAGLASSTNGGLSFDPFLNPLAACTSPTFRPGNYVLSRTDTGDFAAGFTGNGTPPPDFFFGLDNPEVPSPSFAFFTNTIASSRFAAYSALVDNLASEPPPSGLGANITNAPGRIRIYAHDLDLSKTRMRAEAEIMIQATNLISSAGAVLDCQNLSYNLGSTNGFLNITNLANPIATRLQGTISMWSAAWTNQATIVTPNMGLMVTGTTTNPVSMPLTNYANVNYAVTIVDAGGLSSSVQVQVQDLILHSTNMVVSDTMNVVHSLLLDGKSLTIQGNLSLSGFVQNWTHVNAPTLRYFTNNSSGSLIVANDAHFGDDGPVNYAAFVNHGFIESAGQTINSDYLEISNGGVNETFSGAFVAFCETGLVANASIFSANGIQFYANSLTIDPSIVSTTASLDFTVTNLLTDGGIPGNKFSCENGFNLFIKPTLGDLLGSTISDVASGQDEVHHIWAGKDFGATAAGYLNNVAIGTLALVQTSTVFEPLFHFSGTNAAAHNGLYVSNLDLSMLTDYTNEIQIDPNLTIYFVSATLNTNVNISPFPDAQHFLDGQFGGRLRWSGVNSLPTQQSQGISGGLVSGGNFQINFVSGSGQTNIIEASTNLVNWVPIYTNVGSITFTDSAANGFRYRFYRAKTLP